MIIPVRDVRPARSASSSSGLRTCSITSAAITTSNPPPTASGRPCSRLASKKRSVRSVDSLVGDQVDARDVMAAAAQFGGHPAGPAPDVEHPQRCAVGDEIEHDAVRAVGRRLVGVGLVLAPEVAAAEADLPEAVADRVDDDVAGVGDPVDPRDLVAVVGGDRDLDDAAVASRAAAG